VRGTHPAGCPCFERRYGRLTLGALGQTRFAEWKHGREILKRLRVVLSKARDVSLTVVGLSFVVVYPRVADVGVSSALQESEVY
jgi:hypothetical protein